MEQSLIASRVKDSLKICNNSSVPKFVGFLRPEETAVAAVAAQNGGVHFSFFGGYENAERVFFGAFPDWCENEEYFFPITPLTFTYRKVDTLSHRDFLGSFMALGITRESVGDILIEEGRAVAFFTKEVAPFVKEQIQKIGRVGVQVEEGFTGILPGASKLTEASDTVASARLDCVVAALIGASRNTAAQYIEQKMVTLNSICTEKATTVIKNNDKISIRTKGKFLIDSIDEKTKKGRLKIRFKKYI